MYVSYRYRTQIPFSLMRVLYDFRTLLMLLFKCVYFVLFFQKRKKWTICPSFNAPRVLTEGPNVTENWFENKNLPRVGWEKHENISTLKISSIFY